MSSTGKFDATAQSLLNGVNSMVSTKTVVGEAITYGDTTIVPLVNFSFGMAAGSFSTDKKDNEAGGIGGKLTPTAVLVIKNGTVRLMTIATHTGMDKLLDLIPDLVDSFKSRSSAANADEEEKEARKAAAEQVEEDVKNASDVKVDL